MRVYKIFLASSEELANERVAFGDKIQEINDRLIEQKKQVHFTLNKWERDSNSFSNRRKQDDYNNFIENCDIFLMLYWTKVGKYTEEEYDFSYNRFLNSGKPVVFVYQKLAHVEVEDSVKAFQQKTLTQHQQFTPKFENANDLGVAFDNEMQKLFANGTLEYGVIAKCLYSGGNSAPTQFIGREEELQKIRTKLDEGGQLMLINADGGIGKTSLAAKYWDESLYKYKYNAWLFCENGIVQELKKLAPQLNIDLSKLDEAQQLEALKQGLRNASKDFLLILDNANNPNDIKVFEQHFRGFHWHVLITSRCHNVLDKDKEMAITHLPPPLAKELFISNYKEDSPDFDKLLDRLLAAIGYHTLLIEIFSKNIKTLSTYGETMADFLEQLESKGLFLEQRSFKIKTDYSNNVHKSSAETTDAIIEILYDFTKLKEPERLLMVNMALLPAVNYNRLFLLSIFGPENKYEFGGLLDGLVNLGWLSDEQEGYRMSPVVQKLILQKNKESLKTDTSFLLENLNDILKTDGYNFVNISSDKAPAYIALIQKITDNLKNYYSYPLGYVNFCLIVYYDGIGDFPACRKSIENYESISKFLNYQNGLAISYERLGSIYAKTGDYPNAQKKYQEYFNIAKEIYGADPENLVFKNHLSIAYQKLGDIYEQTGDYANAWKNYQEDFRITKEIHKANPESLESQNGLAIAYSKLGDIYEKTGNYQNALKNYKEVFKINEEIHKANPENLEFKDNLAITYERLGNIYVQTGDYKNTLKNYQEYFNISKENHDASPENLKLKDSLAIAYSKLGNIYERTGDYANALKNYQEQLKISKETHEVNPEDLSFNNGIAIAYESLGCICAQTGDYDNALKNYQEYFIIAKEIHEANPENLEFKNGLSLAYGKLGDMYTETGDYKIALKNYQQSQNIVQEIHKVNPENLRFNGGLANSYLKLGEIYAQTGDHANALKNYQEYFIIAKEIHEANLENLEFKNGLAIAYFKLGGIYAQTRDYANALRNYQEYFNISKETYDAGPENLKFKNNRAIAYYNLGGIYQKKNEKEKAKTSFVEARAIWIVLVEAAPEVVLFKKYLKWVEDSLAEM